MDSTVQGCKWTEWGGGAAEERTVCDANGSLALLLAAMNRLEQLTGFSSSKLKLVQEAVAVRGTHRNARGGDSCKSHEKLASFSPADCLTSKFIAYRPAYGDFNFDLTVAFHLPFLLCITLIFVDRSFTRERTSFRKPATGIERQKMLSAIQRTGCRLPPPFKKWAKVGHPHLIVFPFAI